MYNIVSRCDEAPPPKKKKSERSRTIPAISNIHVIWNKKKINRISTVYSKDKNIVSITIWPIRNILEESEGAHNDIADTDSLYCNRNLNVLYMWLKLKCYQNIQENDCSAPITIVSVPIIINCGVSD